MPAAKHTEEWQRHTVQIKLRASEEDAALLRARAEAKGMTISAYVVSLVRAADDRSKADGS